MTEQPLNLILLALVLIAASGLACLYVSPEALEAVARKLRARARALRASRCAYWDAYAASYEDERRAEALLKMDRETRDAAELAETGAQR